MSKALTHTWRLPGLATTAVPVSGLGGPPPAPLVAILCAVPRGQVAAAGVALALARATRRSCALAGAVGEGMAGSIAAVPSAHRAARSMHERGLPAAASGRLVWLADRRGALATDDAAGRAAAMSAELSRSATAIGAPAAIAMPCVRTVALDRVVSWHDAIVVVREPDVASAVIERALASLAELGRPVAAMTPPARVPGALAASGLRAPAEALAAVAELALADRRFGRPDA